MKRLYPTLFSALAFFAVAEMATAEVQVQTDFSYDQNQTLADNYVNIVDTARTACASLGLHSNGVSHYAANASVAECASSLVDQAIAAFGDESLSAFHAEVKAPAKSFELSALAD